MPLNVVYTMVQEGNCLRENVNLNMVLLKECFAWFSCSKESQFLVVCAEQTALSQTWIGDESASKTWLQRRFFLCGRKAASKTWVYACYLACTNLHCCIVVKDDIFVRNFSLVFVGFAKLKNLRKFISMSEFLCDIQHKQMKGPMIFVSERCTSFWVDPQAKLIGYTVLHISSLMIAEIRDTVCSNKPVFSSPLCIQWRIKHGFVFFFFALSLQLIDMASLDHKKTYKTERPVNSAAISSLRHHVSSNTGAYCRVQRASPTVRSTFFFFFFFLQLWVLLSKDFTEGKIRETDQWIL